MELFRAILSFSLCFSLFSPVSSQLSPTETRILFQIQQFLEYPEALQNWNNWTSFCYLNPTQNLLITCSDNHITEFLLSGNRTLPGKSLSSKFSIDSFFTVITKLSNLKRLSLISLGIWGPLPSKINRLKSLELLNLSSNSIYGKIPDSFSTMMNLKSLVLGNNLINGSVPDLKPLQNLQEIDFGHNKIGPDFPSFRNNLSSIILKNNSLRSDIPSEIKNFNLLQKFDVSSNKLVGPIPPPLFSLPSINYLNLADNQLSGAFSMSTTCNSNLSFVDISKNLLIGTLPVCLGSNLTNRTVVSLWNCLLNTGSKYQHANSFCQKQALAVNPTDKQRKGENKSKNKLGLIFGVILGIIIGCIAIGLLIFLILRRRQRKRGNELKNESFAFDKQSIRSSPALDSRHVTSSLRYTTLGLPPYNVFTLEEMEDATNNFDPSNLVGDGSQGQLYKGWLRDGSMVLVKCLKLKQKRYSNQNVQQQMEVISNLRNRHLVSVLGHCIVTYQDHPSTTNSTVFIVLQHVSNGSLRDHLLDWKRREYLKWPQRMGITIGIARGIQFLHTGISPGIFGNDLKIDNILLDDTLTAKISSYNISLPSKLHPESPLHGDATSMCINNNENSEKGDIYQFGVILLEVLTGKPITSESYLQELNLQLETSLAESPSRLRDAIDPSIRGTFAYDSLKTTVEITIKCLSRDPNSRPTIEDVLWHLQYSIQVQEEWTSSGNLNAKF